MLSSVNSEYLVKSSSIHILAFQLFLKFAIHLDILLERMKFSALLLLIAAPLLQASPLAASKAKPAGKSWLGLTTGCTPTACKTCKRDNLSLRNADSLLPRGQATLEPSQKTAEGLNEWTKDALAASKHNLNINGGGAGETPTSQLIQWDKTGLQFATVGGLYGCASVVVVSSCGVYMVINESPLPLTHNFAF